MRLLSYNIHKGIGGRDRRYRLDRILDVIEHENPDIVCLQEVDHNVRRSHFHNQPKLFVEHFRPAAHLSQTNVRVKQGGYGNLLFSRWPMQTRHQISLRLGRRKPRGAQIAVIDSPEGPFCLAHWHLGLAERERHWQTRHLLEHALFRESSHLPRLVVGDTNDWRNTLAKALFAGHGFRQITAPISRFRTFPAWFPIGSLDKVFVDDAVHVRSARVAHTWLARRASDHLPLVVDFHLIAGRSH